MIYLVWVSSIIMAWAYSIVEVTWLRMVLMSISFITFWIADAFYESLKERISKLEEKVSGEGDSK